MKANRNKESLLTQAQVWKLFNYDPHTGLLTRLTRASTRARIGDVVSNVDNRGYLRVKINGFCYSAHRLIYFYVKGMWPVDQIDHANGVKTDNRWCNLREATQSQNNANRGRARNNSSGFKGVDLLYSNFWRAMIKANKKNKVLGYFDCPAAAHFAYLIAADKAFGKFARAA
jgi:hypothetical protein